MEREGLTVDDAGLQDVEVAQSGERVVGGQIRTGDEVVAGGEAADAGVRVAVSDAEAEHARTRERMDVGLIGLHTEVMEVLRLVSVPTGGRGGRARADGGGGEGGENGGGSGTEADDTHGRCPFSRL